MESPSEGSSELQMFRDSYPERDPPCNCQPYTLIELTEDDGVVQLRQAPAPPSVSLGSPPLSDEEPGENRYLWVIDQRGIPYIFEQRLSTIYGELPKHTNLTGGRAAYMGGELWFSSNSDLFVSGGSGRYPPNGPRQLEDAARVFESYQYSVTSLGWDFNNDRAWREYHVI